MRFDGPTLAHAWLAVIAAAEDQVKTAITYKSLAIHEHINGVRLVATNGRLALTTWVPNLDSHYVTEAPGADEAPEQIIVTHDGDGRGRGLLGYVCQLGNRARFGFEDYTPGTVEISLDFHQRLPAGAKGDQDTLEGFESTYTVLAVPDTERVYLEIFPVTFPDPRPAIAKHRPHRTAIVTLDPELLERLAKVRKHAVGPVELTHGERSSLVVFPESDPRVYGLLARPEAHDPDVYQEDQDPDQEPAAEVDPDQTTIDEVIDTLPNGETREEHGRRLVDELETAFAESDQIRDDVATKTEDARLVRHAVELVVGTQFGSARMLERKLGISQTKAAALMSRLEAHGVVGPTDGRKARDVLILSTQLDEAVASILQETR